MSNVNEIKQHLRAVSQTRQITNAMYLLSSSRMRKSMQSIDFNLYYLKRLRSTIGEVLSVADSNHVRDKFIEDNGLGSAVFIVVSSDKGLCGGYNTAVTNLAIEKMKEFKNPVAVSLGMYGDRILRSRGIVSERTYYGASQHPTLNLADQLSEKLMNYYLSNDYHAVYVVYTEYVNSSVQTPRCDRILPLLKCDFASELRDGEYTPIIYEPSIEVVFEHLVKQYVTGFMYDVFMQSAASENIARMTAMQNATRNADEMIKELYTELNAARQLQITNEITEIAAAVQAQGAE